MFISFLLSLDSFAASLAFGLLMMSPQRKCQTCLLFGLCDGLATLAGLHLEYGSAVPLRANHPWIAPAGICVWVLFVAFLIHRLVIRKPIRTVVISLVAVVLSIDNLLAGPVLSDPSLSTNMAPLAVTLLSFSFAVVGFAIAGLLQNRISRPFAVALGAVLLCLSPILF